MPYIGKSPEFGVRERFYYTQTSAGATSISGFDDNGTSLRFTDGNYVDVYLNGVLLVDGVDYGTSTANTISSLSALADGDVIEIVAYDVFNIAKNNAEVTRTRYYKTASGSETSISGNDDSGVTITFPAGAQLDVSLNGVSLVAGTDYNTSTANTISGLSSLSAGQVIEIVKYEKFVVSDTVSKAAGGAFGGAISATSFSGDGSALTGLSGSNIKEQLGMLCDGQNYTVSSGTYTSANVTATQQFTTSYADLTGSTIAYTPPSGTKLVRYQFIFNWVYVDSYGLAHFKFFIDSDEVTKVRTTLGANSGPQWMQSLEYFIPIGGSADTATGRQASWTSAKTLKIQVREYSSSNEAKAHGLFHWDGVGDAQFVIPKIVITALG